MSNKFGILALAFTAFVGSQSAFADQFVTNGGFETGDFSGFTVTAPTYTAPAQAPSDPSQFYGVDSLDADSGSYGAYLSTEPGSTAVILSQALTGLTVGTTYTLSFDLANNGAALTGFPNSFSVSVGSNTLLSETNVGVLPFSLDSLSFIATATGETLSIDATNTASYFSLDNVSVSTATTPEPATFLLVVPAIGLLALRRRKSA